MVRYPDDNNSSADVADKNIIIGDEVELHPVPEAEEEDNDHDYHDVPDDHPKGIGFFFFFFFNNFITFLKLQF